MARPKLNPDKVKKVCPTCNIEFEVSFYKRNIQKFCSKTCSCNNEEIKEKNRSGVKKAFDDKYGTHPMKTEEGISNLKNSISNKYGVEWISKKSGWYDTVKSNNLKKHGIEHYNNAEKAKITRKKWSNEFTNDIKRRTKSTKYKKHYDYLMELFKENNLKFLCKIEDYKGYAVEHEYNFECSECNRLFVNTIDHPERVFCNCCHPEKIDTLEEKFYKFLTDELPKNVIITRRDRTILVGKELDFYIPSMKIAFELNGLYWHSDAGGSINKNYHLNKTKACMYHGIKLIHIFENEWNYKEEIVKSYIRSLLNITRNVISFNANECLIKEVEFKEKVEFLNMNDLQGEDKSTIALGLYNNDILVSLMTFKTTKNYNWELMRYCNKIDTVIVGGASKLFSYFINNVKFTQIVSYSDRRYFDGDIYNKLGFKFVGYTPPNYYYIVNKYKDLKHRMSYQKHKLPKLLEVFDINLSEWSNMKNNGYDRIWDCGNSKFIYTNPH